MRVSVFMLQLFINNKWVDPVKQGGKLDVVDPRTGDTIKQLANAGQRALLYCHFDLLIKLWINVMLLLDRLGTNLLACAVCRSVRNAHARLRWQQLYVSMRRLPV